MEVSKLPKPNILIERYPPDLILKAENFNESKTMIFDLGQIYDIDECVLVPSTFPNLMDEDAAYGFLKFRITGSHQRDFENSFTIHDSGSSTYPNPGLVPQIFSLKKAIACRFLKLEIIESLSGIW